MCSARLWIGVLVAFLVVGLPSQAGEKKGKKGHRQNLEQRVKQHEERIDQRITKIKERLEKHPKASADVKAAADKLITDLTTVKGDLAKLRTDLQAHDKSAVKADRKTLRHDRQLIKPDREALQAALHAKKGKHHAGKKHGK